MSYQECQLIFDEALRAIDAKGYRVVVRKGKHTIERKKQYKPQFPLTGNTCRECGSPRMRRTGTCETCEDCGESQGCA